MIDLVRFVLSLKAIRYFFSAGMATVVDVVVYYFVFNYVLHQQTLYIGDVFALKAPTVSLICSYTSGLFTNFFITKYFVFHESELAGRWQFVRFLLIAFFVLILNYYFMYFLIQVLGWYPTLSRAFSAVTIGLFSFVAHRSFSFK
jgi:putative flippase GtrA